ncbi:MAG: flagellar brake protein [Cellulosilyticaceae bacterium]
MTLNETKNLKVAISNSITQYKDIIFKDLNLALRIKDGEKHYRTHILKWHEDEIIFEAPLYQRDWVLFPIPSTLEITIFTKNALYSTTLELLDKRRVGEALQYRSRISAPIEKIQQRAHFRLDVMMPLEYTLIPDRINDVTTPPDQTIYAATTTNLSAGGLCMVSKNQLPAETGVYIKINFLEHVLQLTGIVLIDGESLPTGTYSHRIRFNGLDATTENLLTKLIFEKQRMMLARPLQPLR